MNCTSWALNLSVKIIWASEVAQMPNKHHIWKKDNEFSIRLLCHSFLSVCKSFYKVSILSEILSNDTKEGGE